MDTEHPLSPEAQQRALLAQCRDLGHLVDDEDVEPRCVRCGRFADESGAYDSRPAAA